MEKTHTPRLITAIWMKGIKNGLNNDLMNVSESKEYEFGGTNWK